MMLPLLFVAALATSTEPAGLPSRVAAADGILVERNERSDTFTIVVPSRHGLLDGKDVLRGLARAAGLDEEAASENFSGPRFDLKQRHARLTIMALSSAVPDVRFRIVDHPVSNEPALMIRVDRGDLQDKVRKVKSLLRDRIASEIDIFDLQLDDQWAEQPAARPLVVLIHGFSAGPRSLAAFHAKLRMQGWPCATFSYPNDGPLADSGKQLARELRNFRERFPQRHIAIVAHSMGGLVARFAIEDPSLDPGNVEQLIMICTPNHGSRWAELPGSLDLWEHLRRSPAHSLPEAFRHSLADGLNEARADLKPHSRFLCELNSRKRNPNVHYSLILGTDGPCTATEIAELRQRIGRSLAQRQAGRLVLPKVNAFLEDFSELERGQGDSVVSVARGWLEGVQNTLLPPITHSTFCDDRAQPVQRKLHDAVIERLVGGTR